MKTDSQIKSIAYANLNAYLYSSTPTQNALLVLKEKLGLLHYHYSTYHRCIIINYDYFLVATLKSFVTSTNLLNIRY